MAIQPLGVGFKTEGMLPTNMIVPPRVPGTSLPIACKICRARLPATPDIPQSNGVPLENPIRLVTCGS